MKSEAMSASSIPTAAAAVGPNDSAVMRLTRLSPMAKLLLSLGALVLTLVLLPTILGIWSKALDPYTMSLDHAFSRPGGRHLLGTDSFGRNVVARLLAAAALTLQAVTVAVITSLWLGVVIGGLAGLFYGSVLDRCIGWVISLIYTVPFYLIAVAVAAIARPGLVGAFFILGLLAWAAPARLVRAEMIQLRHTQYVIALRAAGQPNSFLVRRILLPMAIAPAAVAVTLFVPEFIGVEIGLSFFGLGPQPPTPSLGRELYYGLSFIGSAPWLVWAPAITILMVVLGFFALGRFLGKALPSRVQP